MGTVRAFHINQINKILQDLHFNEEKITSTYIKDSFLQMSNDRDILDIVFLLIKRLPSKPIEVGMTLATESIQEEAIRIAPEGLIIPVNWD